MEPLVLASGSPQRKALLMGLRIPFEVVVSTYAEADHPEREPSARARVLAEMKAKEVAARLPGRWVVGCDTLVVSADGALHEKPRDRAEAKLMIERQSGKTNLVHSGLCVVAPDGSVRSGVHTSRVTFAELTPAQIAWWLGTGLWEGRSGAFQIDGLGQLMIARLEGDWTSVVGLPVFLLGAILREMDAPYVPAPQR